MPRVGVTDVGMNWQFELETSGAYTLRVTVLDKDSAAGIDILDVFAADDKLGSAKLDLGELKNIDAYEDKPLELKTALRPFDPHRADVRGAGIALLLYGEGVCRNVRSHIGTFPGTFCRDVAISDLPGFRGSQNEQYAYQSSSGTCLVSQPTYCCIRHIIFTW